MGEEPKLSWDHVERRLRNSRSYWLSTTRPDGRPHARPVWGVWREGSLWFGTSQDSQKGRNLAAAPYLVAHLESADDVVILEGEVEIVRERAIAEPVLGAYAEKFAIDAGEAGFGELESDTGAALYRLTPQVVHAWLEGAFAETQSRWEPPPR